MARASKKKQTAALALAPVAAPAAAPTPVAQPAGMPPLNLIGPGGGALSAITPLGGGTSSDASYGGYNQYLLGMAAPRGQQFSITPFGGDKMDALHSFAIGADNPIRVTDQSGNVLYSGTGYEGAQAVADLTRELTGNKDIEKFSVEGFDPYTGQWQGLAGSARPTDQLGEFASIALPAALALALPGVGGALGAALSGLGSAGTAALGSALGSTIAGVARGQGIGEIAKNAALSGATAYVGGSIPGLLPAGAAPTSAIGQAATGAAAAPLSAAGNVIEVTRNLVSPIAQLGSAFGGTASGALQGSPPSSTPPATALDLGKTIVVPGTSASPTFLDAFASFIPAAVASPTPPPPPAPAPPPDVVTPDENTVLVQAPRVAPTPISDGLLPAVASAVAPPPAPAPAPPPDVVTPDENTIVVPGTSASPAFLEAFAPFILPAAGAGLAATSLGAATPPSNTITVEADRPTPPGGTLPPAPIPAIAGLLPTAAVTAAEVAAATSGAKAPTLPAQTQNGQLQDNMRYINLGALGVDTLSSLLGGAQGGAGATSPYVSQLGPAPTFGRGAFQPYTGNYETYGFGPEFSFFSPQSANLPSAPVSSMLNPLLPVNNTVPA